jgi:hypothetical protein
MATAAAPLQAPYNYQAIALQLTPVDGTAPVSMSDITTLIINPTSVTRTYSYLPVHGRSIAALGTLTYDGDLIAALSSPTYSRKLTALKNDIQRGYINVFRNERVLVSAVVDNDTVVAVGDMLYLDTGKVLPAASFTWDTDLATTQASFINSFLGIAVEAHAATTADEKILVDISPNSHYYYTCASATYEVGALAGPDKASGNALLSSTLEAAVATSSCARVVQRLASAGTKVVVRFQSAYWGHNAAASQ